jgi:hypothetical protein
MTVRGKLCYLKSYIDDDLPTEEEIDEWTRRSRKEGICGIVNCFNKPTKQCKKCTNYYCSEHFPPHLDLVPDGDPEYSSSNEGLEYYMDETDDFSSDEDLTM